MSRSLTRWMRGVALLGLLLGVVSVAGASWQPAQRISATLPDDRDVASYQLAPDSSALVYTADVQFAGRRALYSVPLRGGLGTQLSPAPVVGGAISQYAITPDSQTVVYLGEVTSTDKPRTYSIGLNGANATQIDTGLSGSPLAFSLAGSTRAVLLVQTAPTTRELYSVRLDGVGAPIRLNHQLPAGGSVGQYALSPDGQWVVFMADGVVDERVELYSASSDGCVLTPLHGPAVAGGDVKEFAIAPDGQRVAFTGDLIVDERFDVYSRPIDGSSLPALVYSNSTYDAARPLISPDSATVAYVITIPGQGEYLHFSPILSGDSRTASWDYGANPEEDIYTFAFTPDSRYLVFMSDAATPGSRIVISKDITVDMPLNYLSGSDMLDFKIAPDGRSVVLRSLAKNLLFAPIDDSFATDPLTDLPADRAVEQYELAPQGDYVFYRADRNADETVELFAVPARMDVIPASQTVKINGIFATYNDVTSFLVGGQGDVVYRADSTIDDKFELYRRINLHEVFLPLNIKG
jgi:Tol biopolymer transport system component